MSPSTRRVHAWPADNYVHDMQDAGMALLESFDALIYDNLFENVKYGIRLSLGSARNQVYSNTFDSCSGGGFQFYLPCL